MKNETQQPKHTPEPWVHESLGLVYPAKSLNSIACFDSDADGERAVACVNALKGKPNPQQWVDEAHIMLGKVVSFEHPELKLGDSRLDKIIQLASQRDEVLKALEQYIIESKKHIPVHSKAAFSQLAALKLVEKIKGGGHE